MTFWQFLQRTLTVFPRTFSSAMEYRRWQLSQEKFKRATDAPGETGGGCYSSFFECKTSR